MQEIACAISFAPESTGGGCCRSDSTYGNAVGVLLPDTLGFGLALLKGVLVLELAAHVDGS